MKIKIFPPAWCSFDNIDERGWLTLPDGSTLREALATIKMPKALAKLLMVTVNGLPESLDYKLEEGDVIGFFTFMVGG